MTNEELKQLVETLYSTVLNPKLDYVDAVYVEDNGELEVTYYYDGEPSYQRFNSFKDFLDKCVKYGNFNLNLV